MTLHITIKRAEKLPIQVKKGTLYIEGAQCGSLVTNFRKENHVWDSPFEVYCSREANLTFQICKETSAQPKKTVVGAGELRCPAFLTMHRKDLQAKEDTLLYRLDIFEDEEALPSGYLLLLIQYDRAALYMGEIAGIQSLKQQYSRLPLFTGKCPTKNLFSILDEEVDNQDYNDIESIYKD